MLVKDLVCNVEILYFFCLFVCKLCKENMVCLLTTSGCLSDAFIAQYNLF